MEEQLISFETAKLAKEKKFQEKTPFYYYYYENNKNNKRLYPEKILKSKLIENKAFHTRYRICGGGPDATDYEQSFVKYKDLLIDINKYPARNIMFQAPTQSLLQKWLRETHNIHCSSWCNASGWAWEIKKTNGTHISIMNIDGNVEGTNPDSGVFDTYEESLENGLFEALKLIK